MIGITANLLSFILTSFAVRSGSTRRLEPDLAAKLVRMKLRRLAVMPIITIYQGASGEGQELAETVAEALGYRCVGREVLVEASRRYRIPEAKLNEIVEKGPHWWGRPLQELRPSRIALQA